MLKTPLYWIAAFNFRCSQISQIYIYIYASKKVVQTYNLNGISLDINSEKKDQKESPSNYLKMTNSIKLKPQF